MGMQALFAHSRSWRSTRLTGSSSPLRLFLEADNCIVASSSGACSLVSRPFPQHVQWRSLLERLASMASSYLLSRLIYAFVILSVVLSQHPKDPLRDFCRRFSHQTAVIGRKLYIDGGYVNANPLSQNPRAVESMLSRGWPSHIG